MSERKERHVKKAIVVPVNKIKRKEIVMEMMS